MLSWISAPSKPSPPTPRTLDPPRTITALNTRPHPKVWTRDPEDLDPLSQVRPSLATNATREALVDGLQPPSRLARTASSAATPSLLALPTRANPAGLTFRASKYAGSGAPPQRCLLPWGLLPLRQPRDFGALSSPGFSPRGFTARSSSRLRSPSRASDLRRPLLTGHVARVSA
jgi:hypothetical protein